MEDARDCAGAALKGHAVVGGLLSPVHASYRFKQKVRRQKHKQTPHTASARQNKWPSQTFVGQVVDAPIRFEMVFSPEFSDVICAPRFCRRLFLFPFGRVLTCARFPGSGRVQIVVLAVRRCMGIQPARMVSQPSCVEKVGLYRVHYYCMCLICVAAFEKGCLR